jgi:hypothetical protein
MHAAVMQIENNIALQIGEELVLQIKQSHSSDLHPS